MFSPSFVPLVSLSRYPVKRPRLHHNYKVYAAEAYFSNNHDKMHNHVALDHGLGVIGHQLDISLF